MNVRATKQRPFGANAAPTGRCSIALCFSPGRRLRITTTTQKTLDLQTKETTANQPGLWTRLREQYPAEKLELIEKLGADYVINHHSDLIVQYRTLGIKDPDYILCLNDTDRHFSTMAELIAPQCMICTIVGSQVKHDLDCLKSKRCVVHVQWQLMSSMNLYHLS